MGFRFKQHERSQNRRRELLTRRKSLLILLGPSKKRHPKTQADRPIQMFSYLILSIDRTNFSSAKMPRRAKASNTTVTNGKQAANDT